MDYFSFFRFPAAPATTAIAPADEQAIVAVEDPMHPAEGDCLSEPVSPLHHPQSMFLEDDASFAKAVIRPSAWRRRSLLTSGLSQHDMDRLARMSTSVAVPHPRRGLSTVSNASGHSVSTAELTSDDGRHSTGRNTTPSPPIPSTMTQMPSVLMYGTAADEKSEHLRDPARSPLVAAAPSTDAAAPEAKLEATLGRKRCIMFACTQKKEAPAHEPPSATRPADSTNLQPPEPRKSALKWACPIGQRFSTKKSPEAVKPAQLDGPGIRAPSIAPSDHFEQQHAKSTSVTKISEMDPRSSTNEAPSRAPDARALKQINDAEAMKVHELGGISEGEDAWISQTTDTSRKMLAGDALFKDNKMRDIGRELDEEEDADAKEEAGDVAVDQDSNEVDGDEDAASTVDTSDDDGEDVNDDEDISADEQDFDDGNESDNEKGFGSSDEEGDAGSLFDFWTPGTTTAATSIHVPEAAPKLHRTTSESSHGGASHSPEERFEVPDRLRRRHSRKKRQPKFRPGTPDLPDSTDFVCGTLDEDRPAEQAWIACREQRKRSRVASQLEDIDPGMPATEFDSDDEDVEIISDKHETSSRASPVEIAGAIRDRRVSHRARSPPPTKLRNRSPPPKHTRRSPSRRAPPTQRQKRPGDLHLQESELRLISPHRLPQGSHHQVHTAPLVTHTTSLPRQTIQSFHARKPCTGTQPVPRTAARKIEYVRGPGDILAGLEKKRVWRERKLQLKRAQQLANAKQEKRLIPGIGCTRMKEVAMGMRSRKAGSDQTRMLSI